MASPKLIREQEMGIREEWFGITLLNTITITSAFGSAATTGYVLAGPTVAVAASPIEYEGSDVHLHPEYMEVGTPYGFVFEGQNFTAIKRSGGDVDVYKWERTQGD